jgi:ribosomal protein S27E
MTQTWGKTIGLFECSRPRAHEAGTHGKAPEYRRRAPKESTLHQAIQVGLPALLQALQSQDKTLPFYVAREFEEFQKCGVLEHGFIRVKCTQCRHEKIVGFSCKRRGVCASCAGKRMVESGVFLSEAIFPGTAPVRQWVVSVPIPLRYWMAVNSELMGQVNSIITRAIGAHYKKAVRHFLLEGEELQTAAVSVIQRFGGALNLNIHFHQLWVDGAYAGAEDEETGHIQVHLLKSKEPTAEDINATLSSIQKRIVRLLMRRGLLNQDGSRGKGSQGEDTWCSPQNYCPGFIAKSG